IAYGECQIETWSGPWGANAVTLRNWRNNVLINGLWHNESDRNAWVHVAGVGWRKLATETASMQSAMLLELAAAKGANRPVNILEDQQTVREVYVL
ncbi:MAG TPA: hypothetical protein VFY80_04880, partial [Burkholderiales bacterium]|nr:hypothetical protein [Burkholderiales bacterium]